MGNSVSCFDPVREHPRYSWPKDHPGREAAIAEKKRQRRQQKIAGLRGNTAEVSRELAKDVPVPKKKPESFEGDVSVVDTGGQPQQELVAEVKPNVSALREEKSGTSQGGQNTKPIDVEEQSEGFREEGSPAEFILKCTDGQNGTDFRSEEENVSEEAPAAVNDVEKHHPNTSDKPEVPSPTPAAAMPDKLPSALGQREVVLVDDAIPSRTFSDENVTEGRHFRRDRQTTATLLSGGSVEGLQPQTTDEDHSSEQKVKDWDEAPTEQLVDEVLTPDIATHSLPLFDNRRAQFEHQDSELPEPRELSRDVFDPVTGEFISLVEYRGRQMARAEGLVKERVEQYEDVVDERAKELAEQAAIEAVRTEVMERHQWRFKNEKEETEQFGLANEEIVENQGALERTLSQRSAEIKTISD